MINFAISPGMPEPCILDLIHRVDDTIWVNLGCFLHPDMISILCGAHQFQPNQIQAHFNIMRSVDQFGILVFQILVLADLDIPITLTRDGIEHRRFKAIIFFIQSGGVFVVLVNLFNIDLCAAG